MNHNKRLTSVFLVLGMVAAAPLAFAQSAPTDKPRQQAEETNQAPPAADASQPVPAQAPAPGTRWEELDADGNGNLSKEEAQRHEALANVFAEVDADSDGQLTLDEYRTYVEHQQALAAQQKR